MNMYPEDTPLMDIEDAGYLSLLALGFVVLVTVLAVAIFGE